MTTDRPDTDDLETLSALFDGALDDDAARFARKRLGHDAQWQESCGRWQLIGDALRGRARSAAPDGFAQRVRDAVAHEPVPVFVPAPVRAPTPDTRRVPMWIGGALAASLAIVAVFVARPPTDAPVAEPAPTLVVAPSVAAPIAATPAATAVTDAPDAPPATATMPAIDTAPTAIASNTDGALPAERRSPRASQSVAAARASTERIARDVQASAEADARVADVAPDPFRPATEIVTRPWPRAVLPNSQAAGALTASFEAPSVESRAFYPFEPPVDVPVPPEP